MLKSVDRLLTSLLVVALMVAVPPTVRAEGTATTPAASPEATMSPGVDSTPRGAALSMSDCKRFIDILAGRKTDKSALADPVFQQFATKVPDLVTCGAVARDSDDLCPYTIFPPLTGDDLHGFVPDVDMVYKNCRGTWSNFHELKAYPKGRSFMIEDVKCRTTEELKPTCERIVAVMRSADASQCPSLGEFEMMCRAFISLDKTQCKAPKGDDFVGKHGTEFAERCMDLIEKRGFYAKGLQAVASSGSPLERQLAKAALGQADACAPYEKAAMALCSAEVGAAAATAEPSSTRTSDAEAHP